MKSRIPSILISLVLFFTHFFPQTPAFALTLRITQQVLFAPNRAEIDEAGKTNLDQLVTLLEANPGMEIRIDGNTDGQEKDAEALGLKRANAVENYLVKHGISANRLEAKSYGSTRPIATNETPEGKAKNRRVEFTWKS
jgi:outer membrane protein OmpA-like peptidoglycan-associated protein